MRTARLGRRPVLAAMCGWMVATPFAFSQPAANGASMGVSFTAYDVVSVKPAHPEMLRVLGLQDQPDGIHGETVTVAMMVQEAYGRWNANLPLDDEVTGLPDWGKGDYFAVDARMSPEQIAAFKAMDKDHQRACRQTMLQALLTDRFKLKVHRETRQVLGYELVVAKGGPKFEESTGSDTSTPIGPDGRHLSNVMQIVQSSSGPEVVVKNFSMEQLANFLTGNAGVGHRVANKTGLTGKYSYTLKFALQQGVGPAGEPADAAAADPAPTLLNALEDQLGLKLQRGTETIDTVVVDHVERPSSD